MSSAVHAFLFTCAVLAVCIVVTACSRKGERAGMAEEPATEQSEPCFRTLTPIELQYLKNRGLQTNALSAKVWVYPPFMVQNDTSKALHLSEDAIIGSWQRWVTYETGEELDRITVSFLPEGKMNYMITSSFFQEDGTPLSGNSSVTPGKWNIKNGYIHWDIPNLSTTAEKVVGLTEKRLTCISGIDGNKYVLYRVQTR